MLRSFDIDVATSLAASVNGAGVPVDKNKEGFAVACEISAASSLNGSLKLQASLKRSLPTDADTSWADVSGSDTAVTVNGCTVFDVDRKNWRWVRVVYTRTGGSATMTTTFNENA